MQKSQYAFFGFLAVIIIGGLAYYLGYSPQKSVQDVPAVTVATESEQASPNKNDTAADPAAGSAVTTAREDKPIIPAGTPATTEQATVIIPSFDVLRVDPDGSVVIAGHAAPLANVDVLAGTKLLGSAKAAANGDFAIVLDRVLKAGDHQLVLRATGTDNQVATSVQTAIVSIPDQRDGQVLALVEEPGQASRMISKPAAVETSKPEGEAQSPTITPTEPGVMPAGKQPDTQKADTPIAVEAVEIEGKSIFVAGQAKRGYRVSVYANEVLLGSSAVSPEGRFLVQSQQPLAVGDYIIRADLIDKANTVIASARVPFRREAGDKISAVARDTAQQSQAAADGSSTVQTGEISADPMENVEGSVIIRKGDNLWTISKRTYGRGTRYTTIYLANENQIKNPDLIWPGQVFTMPKTPLSDEEAQQRLSDHQ